MKLVRIMGILVAAAAIGLGACATRGKPIYNVEKAPIVAQKSPSMNDVRTAIIRAGAGLGWQIQPEGTGRLVGRYNAPKGIGAVIDIEHDTKSYTIKYRDSTGLNAENGTIHTRYNTWIQNLDKRIRTELNLL